MINIDWQQIITWFVLVVGGLGTTGIGGWWGFKKLRSVLPTKSTAKAVERSADAPAPSGAVEWATDICSAMGTAPDSSKLKAILAGSTRDQARGLRITELEAAP